MKTSLLEQALADAEVELETSLVYWTPQRGGSVFEAQYWMPNEDFAYRRLFVRAGCVPSRERPVALEGLRGRVLPKFTRWLAALHALSNDSPMLIGEPFFKASFEGGRMSLQRRPVP